MTFNQVKLATVKINYAKMVKLIYYLSVKLYELVLKHAFFFELEVVSNKIFYVQILETSLVLL